MIDLDTSIFDLPTWVYVSVATFALTATVLTLASKKLSPVMKAAFVGQSWILPYIGPVVVIVLVIVYPNRTEE